MDKLDRLIQSVPANNAAFRFQLEQFLFTHGLDPETKFVDLPRVIQSEICRKAAVDLRGPAN